MIEFQRPSCFFQVRDLGVIPTFKTLKLCLVLNTMERVFWKRTNLEKKEKR